MWCSVVSRAPYVPQGGGVRQTFPRIVFDGVEPGSPQAAALAQEFAPVISQFYLKMSSQHALGIVDQSHGRRQFGDALNMRYTNQFGQETIRVKVAPRAVSSNEPLLQPKKKTPPDWWFIEFRTPEAGGMYPQLAAFLRIPSWPRLDPFVENPTGLSSILGPGYWRRGFASADNQGRITAGFPTGGRPVDVEHVLDRNSEDRQTFILDLRRLRDFSVVSLDFYGLLDNRDTGRFPSYEIVRYNVNFDSYSNACPTDTPAGPGPAVDYTDSSRGGYYEYDVILGSPVITSTNLPANWEVEFGNAYDNSLPPGTSTTGANVDFWYFCNSSITTQTGPNSFHVDVSWLWHHCTVTYYPSDVRLVQEVYEPLVDLRTKLLNGGDIDWQGHRWTHTQELDLPSLFPEFPGLIYNAYSQSFNTWEHLGYLPEPVTTRSIAQIAMPSYLYGDLPISSEDPAEHFNLPYLGTLTVFQEDWAETWSTTSTPPV